VVVERLTSNPHLRRAFAGAGGAYVAANFLWPAVLDRYTAFLEGVAAARGR
jgi:drug/metabolite transporter superfamily protein YnfA